MKGLVLKVVPQNSQQNLQPLLQSQSAWPISWFLEGLYFHHTHIQACSTSKEVLWVGITIDFLLPQFA